jgi:hypothetical protein
VIDEGSVAIFVQHLTDQNTKNPLESKDSMQQMGLVILNLSNFCENYCLDLLISQRFEQLERQ